MYTKIALQTSINEFLFNDRCCYKVAVLDDVIVGTVAVQEVGRETAELLRMYVSASCQRNGVGKMLLDAAVKFCVEARYTEITLECAELGIEAAVWKMHPQQKVAFEKIIVRDIKPNEENDAFKLFEEGMERCCYKVAVSGDVVLGTVAVQEIGNDTAEIMRLYVSSLCRKRGVGTMLMETAIKFCINNGYREICLVTGAGNSKAISIYKKYGFTEVERFLMPVPDTISLFRLKSASLKYLLKIDKS
ncbi:mycothiol acetyltransferase-like [Antedon mediterranea]|uniref:mycothiol acetyltransferase-like n=1 Tax=Antedon mediterranea TaxID=105859 RepID=UPI003AF821D3